MKTYQFLDVLGHFDQTRPAVENAAYHNWAHTRENIVRKLIDYVEIYDGDDINKHRMDLVNQLNIYFDFDISWELAHKVW